MEGPSTPCFPDRYLHSHHIDPHFINMSERRYNCSNCCIPNQQVHSSLPHPQYLSLTSSPFLSSGHQDSGRIFEIGQTNGSDALDLVRKNS